jgi:hypothetical protein
MPVWFKIAEELKNNFIDDTVSFIILRAESVEILDPRGLGYYKVYDGNDFRSMIECVWQSVVDYIKFKN